MTPEERNKINERLAKYMGWRFERQVSSSVVQTMTRVCAPPDGSAEVFPPDFTTDLVAVMEVAMSLAPAWSFRINLWEDKTINVGYHYVKTGGTRWTSGETPVEAIARACYEAIWHRREK